MEIWIQGESISILPVPRVCHRKRERERVMGEERFEERAEEREKEADREIDMKGGALDRYSKRANEAVTPDRSFAKIRLSNQCWQ